MIWPDYKLHNAVMFLQKFRDVIIGSHLAQTVISREMIIAIGAGVIKTNELRLLKEFAASLELTEGSTRNVLKSIDWVKRKGANRKAEPCANFFEEEKFSSQRK